MGKAQAEGLESGPAGLLRRRGTESDNDSVTESVEAKGDPEGLATCRASGKRRQLTSGLRHDSPHRRGLDVTADKSAEYPVLGQGAAGDRRYKAVAGTRTERGGPKGPVGARPPAPSHCPTSLTSQCTQWHSPQASVHTPSLWLLQPVPWRLHGSPDCIGHTSEGSEGGGRASPRLA